MSAKWRVYNRHPLGFTHTEMLREEKIVIPAGDFVLMDYEDAVQFRGQYFPYKKLGDETQDPKSFKCISIEPDTGATVPKTEAFVSALDGKKFATAKELKAHEKVLAQENVDLLVKDETLDAEIEKKKTRKGA